MKTVIIGLLTIFLLLADHAFAADQPAPTMQGNIEGQAIFIHFDRGRLTVVLREAPIKNVLEEIGRRTGIEIVFLDSIRQNISMEFEDLPLEEGVQRLLKDYGLGLVTAGEDSNPLEKVFVVEGFGSKRPGRRHVSPPSPRDQKAKQPPADQPAHPVAALVKKKEIQNYFDVLFNDPGSLAEMVAFAKAAKALSAEEIEPIIQMLDDQNFQPSEWEAALSGVNEKSRRRIVMNLRNLDIKAEVIGRLKQIHQFKMAQ
jgi:hypothetical protein